MRRQQGFTLISTAISIALLALLCLCSDHVFSTIDAKSRIRAVQLDLTETLLLAQRSAVASDTPTVACPLGDSGTCADHSDWSQGWLVFADADADRDFGAGDVLLHRRARLAGSLRIHSNTGRKRLVFQPDGDNAGTNLTFHVCAEPRIAVAIILSNTTRVRTESLSSDEANRCLRR